MTSNSRWDAIIVGGGPAGMSAALMLGRCRRKVIVIDDGQPRNARAEQIHGFLTRDGMTPAELSQIGRRELVPYGVEWREGTVAKAQRMDDGFLAELTDRTQIEGRTMLLATGVRDELPDLPGMDKYYGSSVHHCPYCDAWEHRDGALIAYGNGAAAIGLGILLRNWSADVTACCQGGAVSDQDLDRARNHGVRVRIERVAVLEGVNGCLQRVVFQSGVSLPCDAMFFNTAQSQRAQLAQQLGCAFTGSGGIAANQRQCTGVRGLYVAGDAEREMEFAIVAAAEGAIAAVAMNGELGSR